MKWLKSIEGFKAYMLKNKKRAAKRHLYNNNAEKPRDIYDRFCAKIANDLAIIGFKYFPSQHKLKLESADKKYFLFIKFSSSRYNVAGEYVELSAEFYVESKEIKKFSKNNPLLNYWSKIMIGKNFGTIINGESGNLFWNLANSEEFENALFIIPKATREILIDIFNDLQNSELVIDEIEKGNFELGNSIDTVQYLLMHNKKSVAEKYLSNFLAQQSDKVQDDYKASKKEFEKNGVPKEFIHGMGYGHEIALLEKVYKLRITGV
ncbi:MAG: hypothetical protein AAF573_15380 [Bacteroidota bacterium]